MLLTAVLLTARLGKANAGREVLILEDVESWGWQAHGEDNEEPALRLEDESSPRLRRWHKESALQLGSEDSFMWQGLHQDGILHLREDPQGQSPNREYEGLSLQNNSRDGLPLGEGEAWHHLERSNPRLESHRSFSVEVQQLAAGISFLDGGGSPKPQPGVSMPATAAVPPAATPGGPASGELRCRREVTARDAPQGKACPQECPFWSESAVDLCNFQCVTADECGRLEGFDPNSTIASSEVNHCIEPTTPISECEQCSYVRTYNKMLRVMKLLILVVLVALVGWYIRLRCRPIVNMEGLNRGLGFRARSRLHMPIEQLHRQGDDADRTSIRLQLWDLTTNLCRVPVGGPGLLLFFNFQLAAMVWAAVVSLAWVGFAYYEDPDLLWLGLETANTRIEECSNVQLGREMQLRTLSSKILFLSAVYVGTFAFQILHGFVQAERFRQAKSSSVSGYAAVCEGLPPMGGAERPEERIQNCIEAALGERLVGISVCWNFQDNEADVMSAVNEDLAECEVNMQRESPGDCPPDNDGNDDSESEGPVMSRVETLFPSDSLKFRGLEGERLATDLLHGLQSSSLAFAVFPTQEARVRAMAVAARAGGIQFEDGEKFNLTVAHGEPDTVRWVDFPATSSERFWRTLAATVFIAMALALWALVFFYPYALYSTMFSYSRGKGPDWSHRYVLSVLVVAGNQLMYLLCDLASERIRFKYRDHKEAAYMVLYFSACALAVMGDIAICGITAYKKLVLTEGNTYDGKMIASLQTLTEVIESFPMQQALGSMLTFYAFPACFFIPFVLEPIFTIYLPYHIKCLLVRSQPGLQGDEADRAMAFFAHMDLSRYADILLNVGILIVMLFFPSGFIIKTFPLLVPCHLLIYCLDHMRVLRATPRCRFASQVVDRTANCLVAVLLGLLLACIIYKLCWLKGYTRDMFIMNLMAIAGLSHVMLHIMLQRWVVRRFASRNKPGQGDTYKHVAGKNASNYFSANPVHCLRSRYIYHHKPHCVYHAPGKEDLLRANPEIGLYYEQVYCRGTRPPQCPREAS